MVKINKISLGIRTATTMFRVASLAGQIIDDILSNQGNKHLADDYYSEINTTVKTGAFALTNKKLGNILSVSRNDIVFTKDAYKLSNKHVSISHAIKDFSFIWHILNNHLKVHDVRRIGIVAEHQIQKHNENKLLLDSLACFPSPEHPKNFFLTYEDRRSTKKGSAPDINKSDFINVIYSFYDSELDTQHPKANAINMNIDMQRYYSPLISSNIQNEMSIFSRQFENEEKQFVKIIKEKGLV